jgi:hypothetical protein
MLFCGSINLPEGFRECLYLAHWKHWYTEVNYRSQRAEDLHDLEMQKFVDRVNQLLMSAPAEPCTGFFAREQITISSPKDVLSYLDSSQ